MIRYLNGDEKGASRDLWEEAFPEDSRSFDDYYFLEKMKDNRILVLEEGGVAGYGTHEELMKTCEIYQDIWQIQTGISKEQEVM